jgi:hypothetical protein
MTASPRIIKSTSIKTVKDKLSCGIGCGLADICEFSKVFSKTKSAL